MKIKEKVNNYLNQINNYKEIMKSLSDDMEVDDFDLFVIRGEINKILMKLQKLSKELENYEKDKYTNSFFKVFLNFDILINNYTVLDLKFYDKRNKRITL